MLKKLLTTLACAAAIAGVGASTAAAQSALETMPVWRMQLRLQVCDVSDGGTDDGVSASLRDDVTFDLDTQVDDLERGRTYTYDIVSDRISRVSDIQRIELRAGGDDGVCITRMDLMLNNVSTPFFSHTLPSSRRWIDGDGTYRAYTVSSSTLRAASTWNLSGARAAAQTRPTTISRSIIESMIEATVGDHITGNRLQWGHLYGRAVEAEYRSGAPRTRQHVDLDLEVNLPGPWNPEADIDYDVDYSCADHRVHFQTRNLIVSTSGPDWLVDWFVDVQGIMNRVLDSQLGQLADPGLRSFLPTGGFSGTFATCPTSIRVEDDASLRFVWPATSVARTGGIATATPIFAGFAR